MCLDMICSICTDGASEFAVFQKLHRSELEMNPDRVTGEVPHVCFCSGEKQRTTPPTLFWFLTSN